jgi:hypothetical protein
MTPFYALCWLTGLRREFDIKFQSPNSKLQGNSKFQKVCDDMLGLGIWSFFGFWSLGFGIYPAIHRIAFSASLSNAVIASSKFSSLVSSILLWLILKTFHDSVRSPEISCRHFFEQLGEN